MEDRKGDGITATQLQDGRFHEFRGTQCASTSIPQGIPMRSQGTHPLGRGGRCSFGGASARDGIRSSGTGNSKAQLELLNGSRVADGALGMLVGSGCQAGADSLLGVATTTGGAAKRKIKQAKGAGVPRASGQPGNALHVHEMRKRRRNKRNARGLLIQQRAPREGRLIARLLLLRGLGGDGSGVQRGQRSGERSCRRCCSLAVRLGDEKEIR